MLYFFQLRLYILQFGGDAFDLVVDAVGINLIPAHRKDRGHEAWQGAHLGHQTNHEYPLKHLD